MLRCFVPPGLDSLTHTTPGLDASLLRAPGLDSLTHTTPGLDSALLRPSGAGCLSRTQLRGWILPCFVPPGLDASVLRATGAGFCGPGCPKTSSHAHTLGAGVESRIFPQPVCRSDSPARKPAASTMMTG